MSVETTQVRIGLIDPLKEIFNQETGDTVSGKDVLRQLQTNNVWRNCPKGKYVAVQYNAQTFKFFVDETMVLPESVGRALRKSSAILVGEDKPVIADSLSSICFSVRFSPPKIYRSPNLPIVSTSACVRATSLTSTRLSPVSTYAGNLRLRKSRIMPPVGVGFKSLAPTGVVGFRITTACPACAA